MGGRGHCAGGTWDPGEGLMCGRVGNTRAPIGSQKTGLAERGADGASAILRAQLPKWKRVHVIAALGMLAFVPCGEGEVVVYGQPQRAPRRSGNTRPVPSQGCDLPPQNPGIPPGWSDDYGLL